MTEFGKYLAVRIITDIMYDIQDVRKATVSRLRLMPQGVGRLQVKQLLQTEEDFTKMLDALLQDIPVYTQFLGKVRGVGPRISGTIIGQTMIRFKKISKAQYKVLEKKFSETSQPPTKTHEISASQERNENHAVNASQGLHETHNHFASHVEDETQDDPASQRTDETQGSGASQVADEAQTLNAITEEQFQLAQKTENGDYLIPTRRGIEAFPTISKYWAWWGVGRVLIDGRWCAQKRRTAQGFQKEFGRKPIKNKKIDELKINYNPKMKTLAWKIRRQFVLQGRGYRQIYDLRKDYLTEQRLPLGRCPEYEACRAKLTKAEKPACLGHVDTMAGGYAAKMFIAHLWIAWRRLEGLPVTEPWIIEHGGHRDLVDPEDILRIEEAEQ